MSTYEFPTLVRTVTATVTSGSKTSSAVYVAGARILAVITPTVTSNKATVQGSLDGSAFYPLYAPSGVAVSMSLVSSSCVFVDDALPWRALPYVRLICGSAESANRSFTLVCAP